MEILRVRLGFATNSSSTHSIIVADSAKHDEGPESSEFGWDWFLQKTKDEKSAYMAQQMFGAIRELGESVAAAVVESAFGEKIDKDGYVDHQSRLDCPKNINGQYLTEFYSEMAEDIINDQSVNILGGNDNASDPQGGEAHPNWDWLSAIKERPSNSLIARKNADEIWTLFDKTDGTKIHLRFGGSGKKVLENYRPDAPELVDIKITDYCPFDCSFCYQSSTKNGAHADLEEIRQIAYNLGAAGVFEVALGGGEPTMHPFFTEILAAFRREGISVSFTTKSRHWQKNAHIVKAVSDCVSGYGVSINGAYDIDQFMRLHDAAFESGKPQISFQYIMDNNGAGELKRVSEAVAKSYGTLLVLGYKNIGRGGKRPHSNGKELLEMLSTDKWKRPKIAIDTALANQYEKELAAAKIDKRLFYTEEGRFSMYIDAVEKKFGKSSYDGKLTGYKHVGAALDAFKSWVPA